MVRNSNSFYPSDEEMQAGSTKDAPWILSRPGEGPGRRVLVRRTP